MSDTDCLAPLTLFTVAIHIYTEIRTLHCAYVDDAVPALTGIASCSGQ